MIIQLINLILLAGIYIILGFFYSKILTKHPKVLTPPKEDKPKEVVVINSYDLEVSQKIEADKKAAEKELPHKV